MSRVEELYARFESRFRGTRHEILERLQAYVPLLELVEKRAGDRVAIDCGCGRGEWLELLDRRSWSASGIDTSETMLAEATAHGLSVIHADAVGYLQARPDGSAGLISAFHLVEHLGAEVLLTFLTECARVCAPDGVVVFETPNPENLRVGTATFYLDPTHDKPLPPQLLQFYVEQCGFGHARVVRLNGTPEAQAPTSLQEVMRPLFEGALDYAVIATKSRDTNFLSAIDAFVAKTSQPIPSSLDGAHAYDLALAAAVAAPRNEMAPTGPTDAEMQSVHSAIEAVHNAVIPLGEEMRAWSGRTSAAIDAVLRDRSEQTVLWQRLAERWTDAQAASQESLHALHSAVAAVHNAVQPLTAPQDGLVDRLDVAFGRERQATMDRLAESEQRIGARIDGMAAGLAAHRVVLEAQESLQALHSAVAAVHNAFGRERQATMDRLAESEQRIGARIDGMAADLDAGLAAHRVVLEERFVGTTVSIEAGVRDALAVERTAAEERFAVQRMAMQQQLDAQRTAAQEQLAAWAGVASAIDRLAQHHQDITAAEAAVRHQMDVAMRLAVEDVVERFERSTSWRFTAPLRALSALVRPVAKAVPATGEARATTEVQATTPGVSGPVAPVARRLIYRPLVWNAGRATLRRMPGVRRRILRLMDRRGLLAHPLSLPDPVVPSDAHTAAHRHELFEDTSVGETGSPYPPDVLRLEASFVAGQARQDASR